MKALRIALETWNPVNRATESEMETLLLQTLRARGLREPVTQYEVRDGRGVVVARVDAAYPQSRIALEYDSVQEHSDEFQLARDAQRRNQLQALGYAVLSVRHSDLVAGGGGICEQITAITRRVTSSSQPA